jgi:hypothetical protein
MMNSRMEVSRDETRVYDKTMQLPTSTSRTGCSARC